MVTTITFNKLATDSSTYSSHFYLSSFIIFYTISILCESYLLKPNHNLHRTELFRLIQKDKVIESHEQETESLHMM